MKQSDQHLADAIRALRPAPMSEADVQEAVSNLLGFMELLVEIDSQSKADTSKNGESPCA